MTRALLLLCLSPLLSATPAPVDDLAELMAELEARKDDADEALIAEVAELGTRAALEALVGLYDQLGSVFMRREIVRALATFDGTPDAEQPALQKLMDVAVGARERELRVTALDGLAACRGHGKTFLRMVVESPAQDEVRERAMELHVERHDAGDLAWYQSVFKPPAPVEDDGKVDRRKRRRADDEPPVEPEREVHPLQRLRELAFGPLAKQMSERELLEVFAQDRNLKIKVAAMGQLASRGYSGLEPLASEILDKIDLPAAMRAQAAEILAAAQGAQVAERFIELARKQEVTQDFLRRRMAELLADMRDPKVDRQTEKLIGKGKPYQRVFALLASRNNEQPKVVRKLLAALQEKDDEVWLVALEVVTARRFEEAAGELVKQFEKARQDEARLVPILSALTAIRGDDPEWLATLEGHAAGDEREVRNAALRALAKHGGERYLSLLVQGLQHRDWSTRLAALRGLEHVHLPAVLSPIIARMPAEGGRLLIEFADTLWRLTGKPYRTRAQAWAAWYEQEGDGFTLIDPVELERLALQEENRRLRQVTRVEFFGIRIESTRVIFIIDVSGSMNQPTRGEYVGRPGEIRLTIAKRELRSAIENLETTALYNIVTFSSGVDTWVDGVVGAGEKSREEAFAFIGRLGAGGATNLYESIETAFRDVDVDTIVILSDGEPTAGPVTQPGLIRDAVRRWNENRGIKIHCVAVGGSLDILEWLAADHGGEYVKYQ